MAEVGPLALIEARQLEVTSPRFDRHFDRCELDRPAPQMEHRVQVVTGLQFERPGDPGLIADPRRLDVIAPGPGQVEQPLALRVGNDRDQPLALRRSQRQESRWDRLIRVHVEQSPVQALGGRRRAVREHAQERSGNGAGPLPSARGATVADESSDHADASGGE